MWKIKIVEDFCRSVTEIYVYCDTPQGRQAMDANGVVSAVATGVRFNPALVIPSDAREDLLNALLESGVKPREQSRVEGVLEATKSHLEDMRRLVFEPVNTEVRIQEAGK